MPFNKGVAHPEQSSGSEYAEWLKGHHRIVESGEPKAAYNVFIVETQPVFVKDRKYSVTVAVPSGPAVLTFDLSFRSVKDLAVTVYVTVPLLPPTKLGHIEGNVDKGITLNVSQPNLCEGRFIFYNEEGNVFVERSVTILGKEYGGDIELLTNPSLEMVRGSPGRNDSGDGAFLCLPLIKPTISAPMRVVCVELPTIASRWCWGSSSVPLQLAPKLDAQNGANGNEGDMRRSGSDKSFEILDDCGPEERPSTPNEDSFHATSHLATSLLDPTHSFQADLAQPTNTHPDQQARPRWQPQFAPLALINRAFFRATSKALWHKMDRLSPIFTLLPWFRGGSFQPIQVPEIVSSTTWERFNYYAPLIHRLDIHHQPDVSIPPSWLLQVLTFPGRPDPLFPCLEVISISPMALSERVQSLLFILLGPSLRTLAIGFNSSLPVLTHIPPDWTHVLQGTSGDTSDALQTFLAVVPRLAFSSPQLLTLRYCGPVSNHFFLHISALKSLAGLALTLTSVQEVSALYQLRDLALLEALAIVAPSLTGSGAASALSEASEIQGVPKGSEDCFPYLHTLRVEAREHAHLTIWQCLKPRKLQCLSLFITGTGEVRPYHLLLGLYLRRNPELEVLHVEFIEVMSTDVLLSPDPWPPATSWAKESAEKALVSCVHLSQVAFTNIPHKLSRATFSLLRNSIPSWPKLKELGLRTRLSEVPGLANTTAAHQFPGLTFLTEEIWVVCPRLESLEFPFSMKQILEDQAQHSYQDVEQPIDHGAHHERYPQGHPLQRLIFNTEHVAGLGWQSSIGIAMLLQFYFPHLAVVGGSVAHVWPPIESLVKSYQVVRRQTIFKCKGNEGSQYCGPSESGISILTLSGGFRCLGDLCDSFVVTPINGEMVLAPFTPLYICSVYFLWALSFFFNFSYQLVLHCLRFAAAAAPNTEYQMPPPIATGADQECPRGERRRSRAECRDVPP
ncbi:hypothetical protein NMY22_g2762 [Coprinellus aureogranulatus]|nr:hypothetical protein NMY22_g2762 [Coprinellus aureogranulatus]